MDMMDRFSCSFLVPCSVFIIVVGTLMSGERCYIYIYTTRALAMDPFMP